MLTKALHGRALQVDLVGGYYDAGDNVKFGLPMAFTTTMLAWSIIEFGGLMHGELGNAKAALRWGTDYLLKAATAAPDALYVQVIDEDVEAWVAAAAPRLTPFPVHCRWRTRTRITDAGRDRKTWTPPATFTR